MSTAVLRSVVVAIAGLGLLLAGPGAALADDPAPPAPEVATLPATEVTGTSATLHATVVTHGVPTKAHFEYGTNPDRLNLRTLDADLGSGPGTIPLTETVQVNHDATYYVRVVAENDDWLVSGDLVSFATLRAPTLADPRATDVTWDAVTLHVTVTTNGLPVTLSGAVLGTKTPTPLGPVTVTTDGDVAFPVSGLWPNTAYNWNLVASSAGGFSRVRLAVVKTLPKPATPAASLPTTALRYGSAFEVSGTLSRSAALEAIPFAVVEQPYPFSGPIAPVPGLAFTTDVAGHYAFTLRAVRPTSYGIDAVGFPDPTQADMRRLDVFPALTAKVARAARHRFVVSGAYKPAGVKAKAALYSHGARVGRAVATTGTFRFPARALKPGQYEVRVVPAGATGFAVAKVKVRVPRRR